MRNKTRTAISAVCLISAFFRLEPLLAMEAVSPPYSITSPVEEVALLNDKHGGFYIAYTQGKRLSIIKGASGEAMAPHIPEWYGRAITEVRSLSFSRMGPGQYCAFVGSENGAESLYLLKVNQTGDLVFYRDPANVGSVAEEISFYEMTGVDQERASLFYLQGESLFVSTSAIDPVGQWTRTRVSLEDEKVIAFGQNEIRAEAAGSLFLGWYITATPDGGDYLVLFRTDGTTVSLRRKLTEADSASEITIENTMTGKNRFVMIDGTRIRTIDAAENGFTDGIDITAPNAVKRFLDLGYLSPGKALVVCDEGEGKENAYLIDASCSVGEMTTMVPLADQPYDCGTVVLLKSATELFVAYRAGEKASISVLDVCANKVATTDLDACSSDSFLISAGPPASPKIFLLDKEGPSFGRLFAFDGSRWALSREYSFDIINDSSIDSFSQQDTELFNRFWIDDGYLGLGFANGVALVDPESIDFIPYGKHAVSVYNGIDLLAAARDGELLVYKIGE